MGYFQKQRFSLGQVVIMLALVLIGIGVISYAAVTIPNTFISGTTISSSQVNANFNALATAMPGVNYLQTQTDVTLTTTTQNIYSVTVTAPRAGYLIALFSGYAYINHSTGVSSIYRYWISNSSTGSYLSAVSFRYWSLHSSLPTAAYYDSPSTQEVFPTSGGTMTLYVRADTSTSSSNVLMSNGSLNVIFVPTQY
jgi:hypothetical protein